MVEMGAQYNLSYDIHNQLKQVIDDTATYQGIVIYDYSPGGLRVKKRFNHWVDTCDVSPDPDPDPDPEEMSMMMYIPWPPVDPCVPGYSNDYTYYVRGQSGNVLAEYHDLDEDPAARYVYAGSQRIAMIDSANNVYYYLNDHLGSAGVLMTSTGTVRDRYRYKPFDDASYFRLYTIDL
jgi:hypothetical protein